MKKGSTYTKDISGKKYGALKVINFSHFKKRRSYWNCICDCGNFTCTSRKSLTEKTTPSCGCIPRMVLCGRSGLRDWNECVKYKINSIMNKCKWMGDCLVWDDGCCDKNGYPRTSFLNFPVLVKDLIWFFENGFSVGKCRIVQVRCENKKCINIKHLGVVPYVRRNKTIDRLCEISNNRRESENIKITC